jgi:hypothetical protein
MFEMDGYARRPERSLNDAAVRPTGSAQPLRQVEPARYVKLAIHGPVMDIPRG